MLPTDNAGTDAGAVAGAVDKWRPVTSGSGAEDDGTFRPLHGPSSSPAGQIESDGEKRSSGGLSVERERMQHPPYRRRVLPGGQQQGDGQSAGRQDHSVGS